MNPHPSALAWWRAASVDAVYSTAAKRFSVQGSSIFDALREQLQELQKKPDDVALMKLLKEYAPDAPQTTNYPG